MKTFSLCMVLLGVGFQFNAQETNARTTTTATDLIPNGIPSASPVASAANAEGSSDSAEPSENKAEKKPAVVEVTPLTLPGAETFVFKKAGDTELRLHVVKPQGWSAADKRSCLVSFFGGGWINGTPAKSIRYAKWAASQGMVGVAPDYRTRSRFNTPPEECVADGRAAVRWVQDHAAELGIDPAKVVVQGSSAGGHVAAWTAITDPVSPATASDPKPSPQPAALILLWPVTDTTATGYGGPKRFGNDEARAAALSVPVRMPAKMPPTIVFHGTGDKTVKFENSQAFLEKMKATGNSCSLTPFPDAPHSPNASSLGAKGKEAMQTIEQESRKFLLDLHLIDGGDPAVPGQGG